MEATPSLRVTRARVTAQDALASLCRRLPREPLLRVRRSFLAGGGGAGQATRRAVLALVRLGGIPQTGPFPVPGYPDVRMVPTDSYIVNHLFWLGAASYESGGPDWWARLVACHTSALEVGANVGLYTLVAAVRAPEVPYRAVEPNPPTAAALRRNLAVNGIEHVRVDEAAAVGTGEEGGEVVLRVPARDRYEASAGAFVEGGDPPAAAGAAHVRVPALPAATLFDGVDLAKLDIEGLEPDVLGAVRRRLVAERPTLVVEVLDGPGALRGFLTDLVADAGYRCVVVDGRPGQTHATPTAVATGDALGGGLQRRFRTRDVTLIAPERLDTLGPVPPAP